MIPSDEEIYEVVINLEKQYSIWPQKKDIPYGWQAVGKFGPQSECLAYIKEVWTDMRPKSLKEAEAISEMKEIS